MNVGLCGLPQSGKTTLFNALTGADYEARPGRVEVHIEVTPVEDGRLTWLWSLEERGKLTPAQITYTDVAGLAKGEGGGSVAARFINELRRADALLVVLRAFSNPNVPHPEGSVAPARDYEVFLLELGVADLGAVRTRLGSVGKGIDRGDRKAVELAEVERGVLGRLGQTLEEDLPASSLELAPAEEELIRGLGLLTRKPMIALLNADADGRDAAKDVEALARSRVGEPLVVFGKLAGELAELEPEEAGQLRREFDVPDDQLQNVVQTCYGALDLHSFFTTNEKETRAWTLRRGGTALEAAACVHSDIARGFIRAEVAHFEDLKRHGSFAELKKRGLYRTEGRDYVVRDGDVILFRFST
jgi:GTP-binding protein YchF